MNRLWGGAAFGAGLMAVGWVGVGYLGGHPLALAMTVLIGAFYLLGAWELRRYHHATTQLAQGLAALPESPLPGIADWLARLPTALRHPVRQRIEGERIGLPGPVLTPYLVGLLVLLGMLGTFLGMVVTLNGAVLALESTTDLPTIRAALAAPVKGLGLAFGTSVAGVAASAMLGLMSALCRRSRLGAVQLLDNAIAGPLRGLSQARQQQAGLLALQDQILALPEQAGLMASRLVGQHAAPFADQLAGRFADRLAHQLADQLATQFATPLAHQLAERLAQQLQPLLAHQAQQQQAANAQLLASQDRFQAQATAAYTGLAAQVGQALQTSLADGARLAGDSLQPVVAATLAGLTQHSAQMHSGLADAVQATLGGLAQQARQLHQGLADTAQAQAADVSAQVGRSLGAAAQAWGDALAQHQQRADAQAASSHAALAALTDGLGQRSAQWLASVDQAQRGLQADLAAADAQRQAAWAHTLQAQADALQAAWQAASTQAQQQQAQICQTLQDTAQAIHQQAQAQARSTISEIAALAQAAAQAPQAAADTMRLLRQNLVDGQAQDLEHLAERNRLMAALTELLAAVQRGSAAQQAAIESLVASSATVLQQAGQQFSHTVAAQAAQLAEAGVRVASGAIEVAALGDAFGGAVQMFSTSNAALVAQLQRIEAALSQSSARSDEQLAYYVAQARELIDLSILSQQQVVQDLQQLAQRPATLAGEAA